VEGEFSVAEHDHILGCVQCLRLILFCLESDSFAAVLQKLKDPAA
jgi:hypothetical protein